MDKQTDKQTEKKNISITHLLCQPFVCEPTVDQTVSEVISYLLHKDTTNIL